MKTWTALMMGILSIPTTFAGLIFTNEENEVNTDNFIINADNSSSDYTDLEFGSILGGRIRYDVLNKKFSFNKSLTVNGKISTNNYLEVTPWQDNSAVYGSGSGNIWYNGTGGSSTAGDNMLLVDGGTGFSVAGNLGVGTINPTAKLEVNGQVKISGGTPGEGKVLTSDASGLATWESSNLPSEYLELDSSKTTYENVNASFLLEGDKEKFQYSNYINANPTKREIVRDYSAPGASGSLKVTGTGSTYLGDDLIAVNSVKKYRGVVTAMQPATNIAGGRYYWGISSYDADKLAIQHQMVNYYGNTVTTLTQDLNTGDTVLHLADATNWINTGGYAHQKVWRVWRLQPDGKYAYRGLNGKQYDELGYSREGQYNAWNDGDVDFAGNTVTLKTAWTGENIPAGTKIANFRGGGTYTYYISSKPIINDGNWDTYKSPWFEGEGKPQDNGGNDNANAPAFRNGTSYVRVMALPNYRTETNAAYNSTDVGYYSVLGIESTSPDNFAGKDGSISYDGNVTIDGFTKLGAGAPAIKQKKLTGTTAATEGGSVSIPMGVGGGKVLGISGFIEYSSPTGAVELGFNRPDNLYNSSFYISGNNLVVTCNAGESANILSKPIRIIITYEE